MAAALLGAIMGGAALAPSGAVIAKDADTISSAGKAVYDYYCYQCHGYAGDARTLASTYLDPKPRDFSRTSPRELSAERMLEAVRHGRPGTAMAGFAKVLKPEEIEAVVQYVRREFMASGPSNGRYHIAANGWSDHRRYAAAFPFATGEIPLDTPLEALDPKQRNGRQLYMTACITCHDHARVADAGPAWEPRAVSFPRRHYSHKTPDAVSGASPYRLHERSPVLERLSEQERRGRALYLQNCAFCHAPDGTGRNWIGSFLEPHPRDLTDPAIAQGMSREQLKAVIREGLPGTSMPAWKYILREPELNDLIAYVKRAFGRREKTP